MSFDQGTWDAITRLQNGQGRVDEYDAVLDGFLARLDKQDRRIAELERRFKEMKKAVWHA